MTATGSHLARELQGIAADLEAGAGPALLAPDVLTHPFVLEDLVIDPRPGTTALVAAVPSKDDGQGGDDALRVLGGRVLAASSGVHRTSARDAVFTGALRVADHDRAAAARCAREAAALAADRGWTARAVDVLLVALVRAGVPVAARPVGPWPWLRGGSAHDRRALEGQLSEIDESARRRLELARAAKTDDGAVATVLSRPVARLITPWAVRAGLRPNHVTVASLVVGLAAAVLFALGRPVTFVAGAVLLQVSLVVDCVDGDLARATRSFSATGAWLDATTDRVKEFACYGGLAIGAGTDLAWLLASAMLVLQTVRHSVDYTFTAVMEGRAAAAAVVPLDQATERPVGAPGQTVSGRAVSAYQASNRRAALRWAKRVLHMSIGERWLVLSVLAAVGRPAVALGVLLVLGVVSLAYTSIGRTLRTMSWPRVTPSREERRLIIAQADPGILGSRAGDALALRSGRAGWGRPAALRAVEYLVLLGVAAASGVREPLFALLLVVASHHYDLLYRALQRLRAPAPLVASSGFGSVVRPALVAVLALAGGDVLAGGVTALAALLGMLYLVIEPWQLWREVRRRAPDAAAGGDG